MLVAMILATKYLDDKRQKTYVFAKIGEISTKELNLLEAEFLENIDYNLYVHPFLFYRYRKQLLAEGRPLLMESQNNKKMIQI